MVVKRDQIKNYMLSLYPEFDNYGELKDFLTKSCDLSDEFFINEFFSECAESAEYKTAQYDAYKETLSILSGHDFKFASYFSRFIAVHYNKIYSAASDSNLTDDPQSLTEDIVCRIYTSIYNIGIRVLISDLETAKESGLLIGDTPAERLEYYSEELLTDENYLSELHSEYRLMYSLLTKTAEQTARFARDIIANTAEHRDEIAEKLCGGRELGSLRYIKLSDGDTHKDCRSVTILGFDNAKVVYKPHSLESEKSFQQLIETVNSFTGGEYELRKIRIICCDGYGFAEFIEHSEAKNMDDVRLFYKKSGILTALLYTCNMSDCHFENIIACGSDPVLIDTETIFHCLLPDVMYQNDKNSAFINARYFLNKSVGSIGLLPSYISIKGYDNELHHLNLGGMAGSAAQESPFMSYDIDNEGSDNMYLVRRKGRIKSSCNAPVLNGMEVDPHKFSEDIIWGFDLAYRAIMNNRTTFTKKVLSLYGNKLNRVVLKATMFYGNLLNIATHPDLMRSETFARFFFSRAGLIRTNINISDYETTSLLSREIPIYYANFSEKHIINGCGSIYENALDRSPMEDFISKMNVLSENDLSVQLHMIRSSYFVYDDNADHCRIALHDTPTERTSPADLLKTALNIGNYLIEQRSIPGIERSGKKGRFFFGCSVERCDHDDFTNVLTRSDLYNGSCGIALFLYYLGKISGEKRFTDACFEALETVKVTIESGIFDFDHSTGAFTGISGTFYVLSKIAEDSNDDSLRNLIKNNLHYISEFAAVENRRLDLIAGTSGALAVLLSIAGNTSDCTLKDAAMSTAEKCFSILQNSLLKNGHLDTSIIELNGFSHGISGALPYLYEYHITTGSEAALTIFRELLDYERKVFCVKQDNKITGWYANTKSSDIMISWCHGIPGILLGKVMLKELGYNDCIIDSEIEAAARLVEKDCIGTGISYCHGDLGNLSILKMYAKYTGDETLLNRCSSTFAELHRKYLCGIEANERLICQKYNGLMIGIAGAGYACLNEIESDLPLFLKVE